VTKRKNVRLDTDYGRNHLKVRRAPYWQRINRGCSIGYRKTKTGGIWIAKWEDITGKRRQKSLGPADETVTPDTCLIGFQEAVQQLLALSQTSHPIPRHRTIGEAMDAYMEYLELERSPSTVRDARYRIHAHILPTLGKIRLNSLTTEMLLKWRKRLLATSSVDHEQARKSKDTANRVTNLLKAALNKAFQLGWCESDLAWRRVRPFKNVGASRTKFLSEAEASKLIAHCPTNLSMLVQAALFTGCRFGELNTLQQKDFDPINGTLHIRRGKTGSRFVYLSRSATQLLRSIVKGKKEELVFQKEDGSGWTKEQQRRALQKALIAANLPPMTFYELRHSHASIALSRGINHQILAENMGTSIRMLEKHYGKFMNEQRQAAMYSCSPQIQVEPANEKTQN